MESGLNMVKKALEIMYFTETTKLGSRDLRLKKEMTASFSIQLIRALNKYQLLHIKMYLNTLKHAK
jgi:MinD superfamily P-loop ATPase